MLSPRLTSLFSVCSIVILLTWGLSYSPASGYKREYFGEWKDLDHDGQDTRYEMLLSTSLMRYVYNNQTGDRVVAGMWVCPYTGEIVVEAAKLDIDHIVPLAWAWEHGASSWSDAKREEFANDPLNLLVVVASVNRSKGSRGPRYWLPPNLAFVPDYINLFVKVCLKYDLDFPADEYKKLLIDAQKYTKGISLSTINGV